MNPEQVKDIRLLLVDDDAQFRNVLARRLRKRGMAAMQAAGGGECLAALADQPVDVVVMDVRMPGMSGVETLHRIRKRRLETEVILLTGHADARDGVEGIKSGAFDYLSKPVEFDHLLGKIIQAYEKILGEKQKKEADEYRSRVEQRMIAAERLAALGTLAAGVAHEINNPLAIINEAAGYLTSLLQKQELADTPRKADFEKALGKIERSVERARSITHQLLGNVRGSDSIPVEVDAVELVNETIQLIHKEAGNKDIAVVLRTPGDPMPIRADPDPIRQVLINLLNNAIHASPERGRIAIGVEPIAGGASISVVDAGPGIPKERLDKIFEPFYSTKEPGEGTGLGLFVSREIVRKMGGAIEVDSRVGHGARFTVRIPDRGGA